MNETEALPSIFIIIPAGITFTILYFSLRWFYRRTVYSAHRPWEYDA